MVEGKHQKNAGYTESSGLKLALVNDPHYTYARDKKIDQIGRELEAESDLDAVLYLGDYSIITDGVGNLSIREKKHLAQEFFKKIDPEGKRINANFYGVVVGNDDDPESIQEVLDTQGNAKYTLLQGTRAQVGKYEIAGFGGRIRDGFESKSKVPKNTLAISDYADLESMLSGGTKSPQYTVLATHEYKVYGGKNSKNKTEKQTLLERITKSQGLAPPAVHVHGHDHRRRMNVKLTNYDTGMEYEVGRQEPDTIQEYGTVSVMRENVRRDGDDQFLIEYSRKENPALTVSVKPRIAMNGGYAILEIKDTGDYRSVKVEGRRV